ncbi:MAG: PDZ domain-containing protein [Alcanivorax sp.]
MGSYIGWLFRTTTMGLVLWGCVPYAMAVEFALHDGSVLKTDGDNFVMEANSITGPVTITSPNGTVSEGEMVKGGWQGPVKVFAPSTGLRFMSLYDKGVLISTYSELEADIAIGRYDKAFAIRGERPFVGVAFDDVVDHAGEAQVTIKSVIYNSPADLAGFQAGDRILAYNGKRPRDSASLVADIQTARFGDTVTFKLKRNGEPQTVTFAPHIIPADHALVKKGKLTSSKTLLWQSIQRAPTQSGLADYINEAADPAYLSQAKALRDRLNKQEAAAYRRALKTNTLAGYIAYSSIYDLAANRKEVDKRVLGIQEKADDPVVVYRAYRQACRTCGDIFPGNYAVLDVGPDKNATVGALLKREKAGASMAELQGVIDSHPYFRYSELTPENRDLLLFLGMSETLLAALERAAKPGTVAARSSGAAPAATPAQDTLTDTAVECTKLAVALEGCDRLGSFAAMGCRAVVRKKFQCPGM